MAKVILDAGHGGIDTGDIYNGWIEKENTLELTLAVGQILEENGVEVVYTREEDITVPMTERIKTAIEANADLMVIFHRAKFVTSIDYSGAEAIVNYEENRNGLAYQTASQILSNLSDIGFINLGIIQASTGIDLIHGTDTPAIMLFVGFIDSDKDNNLYLNNFDAIVNTIADGILSNLKDMDSSQANKLTSNENGNQTSYHYRVQVGLFRQYENAERLQLELYQQGYPAQIIPQGEFYAVQVGDFSTLDEAAELERNIRLRGYNTLLVAV